MNKRVNAAKSNKDPTDAQTLEAARATLAPLPTLNMWLQGLSGALAETERTKARNARNAQRVATSHKAKGARPCAKCRTPDGEPPLSCDGSCSTRADMAGVS